MPQKKTVNNNRVYFISKNPEEDLTILNDALKNNNISFIDKIYKTSINTANNQTTFINININAELLEEVFFKVSIKLNKILNQSYKMFYKDAKNKFAYIPEDIKENINNSLKSFIDE